MLKWSPVDSRGITTAECTVEVTIGAGTWSYFITDGDLVPELREALCPEDRAQLDLSMAKVMRWHLYAYWAQKELLFGLGEGVALNYISSANNSLWCDKTVRTLEEHKAELLADTTGDGIRALLIRHGRPLT